MEGRRPRGASRKQTSPVPDRAALGGYPLTDSGNAERLAAYFGANIRYDTTSGRWLVWTGTHWSPDQSKWVERITKDTARFIAAEAAAETSEDRRVALLRWAAASESANRRAAMLRLLPSEPGISVPATAFDKHPFLLNTPSGTIELRSGKIRPHDRKDLLTKCLQYPCQPGAGCERWLDFLQRVLGGDKELIAYVQRAVGYSLTGDTSEQTVFYLLGPGANGKSVFLRTVSAVMGPYAKQAAFATFEARHDTIRNDLADLADARLVCAIETEDARPLSPSIVKWLTGGEAVKARFLYSEFFSFEPQFKIWLAANHAPCLPPGDEAAWRRVQVIPFRVTIPKSERDPYLAESLRAELPGILNWALDGCKEWAKRRLDPPEAVLAETDRCRALAAERPESDGANTLTTEPDGAVETYLAQRCVRSPGASVSSAELYADYASWARETGAQVLAPNVFGRELSRLGVHPARGASSRARCGIALLPKHPQKEPDC